jgi:hypothetical protein
MAGAGDPNELRHDDISQGRRAGEDVSLVDRPIWDPMDGRI